MAKLGKWVQLAFEENQDTLSNMTASISAMQCYSCQGAKPSTVNVAGAGILQDRNLPV